MSAGGRPAPLRVGIDARSGAATGGVQQFTIALAHGLATLRDGDEEYLFLAYPDDVDWLRPVLGSNGRIVPARLPISRRRALAPLRRASGAIPATRRWYRRVRQSLRGTVGAAASLPASAGELEESGADVIHFVRQAAFVTPRPSLYHPWDLQHRHHPEFFSPAESAWRDFSYREFCGRARRVVCATTWTKDDLVASYGLDRSKIVVIPVPTLLGAYPVPTAEQEAEVRARLRLPQAFLFYPAQTFPHKNHIALLEAISLLRDRSGIVVDLVCTGFQNGHFSVIESRIAALRLESQVSFLGFVEPVELQCLYRLARGLVFPSLFEGWGLPITEAFEAGTPVACSSTTSLPALVADAALVFDPMSVTGIADAIERLWSDEALRRELTRRGHARLREFDSTTITRKYRALYRSSAGRGLTEEDRALLAEPPIV